MTLLKIRAMPKRLNLLAILLIAFPLCAASEIVTPNTAIGQRPNILFVMADQWRAEAFGFAGNPDVKTPNFDQLHHESIYFKNAVAAVPVCSPTRASLMTGQRALTHGVFLNDVPLATNAITIAKVLQQSGYDTAIIGKWHLDGHGRFEFIPRERRQGFEYWKVMECTHRYNNSFYYGDTPTKLKWEGYDVMAQTQDARQYLRNHARSTKPFFLYLSWGPPHDPYQAAPAAYRKRYEPSKILTRANVPQKMRAASQTDLAGYYAHCTAIDDCMGELLRTLKETGLDQNTVLVFTSDHGAMLGSHGLQKKQYAYDEANHVPVMFRWPAGLGNQARELDTPINSPDFMPTLLGLCRVAIPETVEGIDYSGYLKGKSNPSDGATLISCIAPFGESGRDNGGREYRGIRTARYTYVRDLNGPWLFFDNQADPYQMNNLVGQSQHATLQAELEKVLARKLAESKDEFLPAQAYIQKWGYTVDAKGQIPYYE
ncbi:MAG: arylsulfatase [Pedosphaera sp.]|nr:arylsulfatase [Pedosphaera sp.]